MASSKVTTDHDEIRRWVEARGGFPAHVRDTGGARHDLGILRIDFPGFSSEEILERVDWDTWFAAFDKHGLAFLHQDESVQGEPSCFSQLVEREG